MGSTPIRPIPKEDIEFLDQNLHFSVGDLPECRFLYFPPLELLDCLALKNTEDFDFPHVTDTVSSR